MSMKIAGRTEPVPTIKPVEPVPLPERLRERGAEVVRREPGKDHEPEPMQAPHCVANAQPAVSLATMVAGGLAGDVPAGFAEQLTQVKPLQPGPSPMPSPQLPSPQLQRGQQARASVHPLVAPAPAAQAAPAPHDATVLARPDAAGADSSEPAAAPRTPAATALRPGMDAVRGPAAAAAAAASPALPMPAAVTATLPSPPTAPGTGRTSDQARSDLARPLAAAPPTPPSPSVGQGIAADAEPERGHTQGLPTTSDTATRGAALPAATAQAEPAADGGKGAPADLHPQPRNGSEQAGRQQAWARTQQAVQANTQTARNADAATHLNVAFNSWGAGHAVVARVEQGRVQLQPSSRQVASALAGAASLGEGTQVLAVDAADTLDEQDDGQRRRRRPQEEG